MTGIIYDIKRFAIHDGPGIRTTVFLKGCPLDCWWCHNPESRAPDIQDRKGLRAHKNLNILSRAGDKIGSNVTVDELMQEIRRDQLSFDESGGGVTFSGGEPLLQPDFLAELSRRCREEDIHTAIDTSGYVPWTSIEKVLPFTGLFLYDIKLLDERLHRQYTGVPIQLILDNLRKLLDRKANVCIRVPLVPGITDTEANLKQIGSYLKQYTNIRTVSLLPFNQMAESKYERLEMEYRTGPLHMQTDAELEEKRAWLEEMSLKVHM